MLQNYTIIFDFITLHHENCRNYDEFAFFLAFNLKRCQRKESINEDFLIIFMREFDVSDYDQSLISQPRLKGGRIRPL